MSEFKKKLEGIKVSHVGPPKKGVHQMLTNEAIIWIETWHNAEITQAVKAETKSNIKTIRGLPSIVNSRYVTGETMQREAIKALEEK